jgi:hypothetical protein
MGAASLPERPAARTESARCPPWNRCDFLGAIAPRSRRARCSPRRTWPNDAEVRRVRAMPERECAKPRQPHADRGGHTEPDPDPEESRGKRLRWPPDDDLLQQTSKRSQLVDVQIRTSPILRRAAGPGFRARPWVRAAAAQLRGPALQAKTRKFGALIATEPGACDLLAARRARPTAPRPPPQGPREPPASTVITRSAW